VEAKTTIPVLSHFRLDAMGAGVVLSATNLELGVVTRFGATVETGGGAAVPAKRLVEILKALPEGDVVIESLENHWVRVTSGKARFKLVGLSAENFPVLPKGSGETVDLAAADLGDAIGKVSFAISKEVSRYTLDGALLIVKDGITLVATDGHRLAMQGTGNSGQGTVQETRTLVPRKALGVLKALVDKRGDEKVVAFAQDESHLFFGLGERTLIARRLTGQFPNYEAVLPKENAKVATMDAADLARAVSRVGLIADERTHAVKVTVKPGKVEIESTGGDSGEARDSVEAAYEGEAITIGFNFRYVLDFLGAVTGPVRLMLKDDSSAAELRPEGDGYRYVLMPMRV